LATPNPPDDSPPASIGDDSDEAVEIIIQPPRSTGPDPGATSEIASAQTEITNNYTEADIPGRNTTAPANAASESMTAKDYGGTAPSTQPTGSVSVVEHFVPLGGSLNGTIITPGNVKELRQILQCVRGTYLGLNNHVPISTACLAYATARKRKAEDDYETNTPMTNRERNNISEKRKYLNRKKSALVRIRTQEYENAVYISIGWFVQLAKHSYKQRRTINNDIYIYIGTYQYGDDDGLCATITIKPARISHCRIQNYPELHRPMGPTGDLERERAR